jgi:hypothetical protein
MANCLLNDDLLKSTLCGYSLGEIARIYLANYEDVSATTLDTASGTSVDTITMVSGKRFYQIDPAKNSATWTDELVVADSGAKYRTHTLNSNIIGSYTPEWADIIDALALGKYVAVIKRSDGVFVMLGRTAGLEATVATVGGSSDDSVVNGLQVTLTANAAEIALPLSETAIRTVEADRLNP